MALGRAILALCALAAAGDKDLERAVNELSDQVKRMQGPGGPPSSGVDFEQALNELSNKVKTMRSPGADQPDNANLDGLHGLGPIVQMLGGLTDQTPGFECEPGEAAAPKMDHHEQMSANGCGPQGLQIRESFGLHKCCNGHDVCFSVCGASHQFCERAFARCMRKICKQPLNGSREDCKKQAKTFKTLTTSLGKSYHTKSQEQSCECLKDEELPGRHRAYLQSFLQRYNESEASDELVDASLERWKGKEGELYFNLVKTYGKDFVRFDDIAAEFHRDEL